MVLLGGGGERRWAVSVVVPGTGGAGTPCGGTVAASVVRPGVACWTLLKTVVKALRGFWPSSLATVAVVLCPVQTPGPGAQPEATAPLSGTLNAVAVKLTRHNSPGDSVTGLPGPAGGFMR